MLDYILLEKYSKDISILFVEDDFSIRTETKELLAEIFSIVHIAVDGKDGLEKYLDFHKTNDKYFDLVLSDIKMPNMDGIDLVKAIYKENPKQIVLVLSAHNESEYLMELINIGIRQFILKPLEYNNFLDVIFKINKDIYFEKNEEKASDLIKLAQNLFWNKKTEELIDNNCVVKLTKKELILISLLLKYPEKTCDIDEIISMMWLDDIDKNPDITNLKNIISRLRKKVPDLNIENIYSFGYKIHISLD
jgi:DNA-binding response OmpR family regulator